MDFITISAQTIEGANDFLSIGYKDWWAKNAAADCITSVEVNVGGGDGVIAMPEMYSEDGVLKSLYLTKLLVSDYLGVIDKERDMDVDLYDQLGRMHIKNQLERIKFSKCEQSIKDKVFDILTDFYDCERRLNDEIKATLRMKNDATLRIMSMVLAQTTPDSMQKGLEMLKDLEGELKNTRAEREGETAE